MIPGGSHGQDGRDVADDVVGAPGNAVVGEPGGDQLGEAGGWRVNGWCRGGWLVTARSMVSRPGT